VNLNPASVPEVGNHCNSMPVDQHASIPDAWEEEPAIEGQHKEPELCGQEFQSR
jgi:hypothetical protein